MHLNALAQVINRHCGPKECHANMCRNRTKQVANQVVPLYDSKKIDLHLSVEAYNRRQISQWSLQNNPSNWSRTLSWTSNTIKSWSLIRIWLVVSPPLCKIWKSLGMMTFPICEKKNHVPNHQPENLIQWNPYDVGPEIRNQLWRNGMQCRKQQRQEF